ncbi:MAG: S8 family serine peptidase, partial [Candidatus Eisenbacteria bacterium]|nr:S8 family serine peptidase [Candidatus Eisenbacteria bacterium]
LRLTSPRLEPCLPPLNSAAAHDDCSPGALLLRFEPGVISFGPEIDDGSHGFTADVEDAEIAVPELRQKLGFLGARRIATIAPSWRYLEDRPTYDSHGNRVELVDFTDIYRVTFSGDYDVGALIDHLRGMDGIAHVECDEVIRPLSCPEPPLSDSYYPQQWHLNNTGQSDTCETFYDINAPEGWAIWCEAGTKIGICGGPLNRFHEDLGPYISRSLSRSFTDDPWWGIGSHGEAVAGVAAAGIDNDEGVCGVANAAPDHSDSILIALRIMASGLGNDEESKASRADSALSYITSEPVFDQIMVVNFSWGAKDHCEQLQSYNTVLRDAFRNAFLKGVSLVCSAGNGPDCSHEADCDTLGTIGTCVAYPAGFGDFSFAVTGIGCTGYDAMNGQHVGSYINISAPGKDIWTTLGTVWDSTAYAPKYGTSFASPQAAAAIALLLGRDPGLTNEDCYRLLEFTASELPGYSMEERGHGLMRLDSALAAVTYPRAVMHDSVFVYSGQFQESRWQEFRNVRGLNQTRSESWDSLWVHVYKLQTDCYLWDPDYAAIETVWGRGRHSTGWKDLEKYDYLFHANYTAADWDLGQSKATLSTFAYKVFTDATEDSLIGWFPTAPDSGYRMDYSVLLEFKVDSLDPRVEHPVRAIEGFEPLGSPVSSRDVSFRLDLGRAGRYSLAIYDISGRLVRDVLSRRRLGLGEHRILWDGRNSEGRGVAPGVYLARVRRQDKDVPTVERTARVTILK